MTPSFLENLKTHMEARLLLSAVLCQPEPGMFMEEKVCERLATAFATLTPEAGIPVLKWDDDTDLLVAHTKLFVGPDKIPAQPYGSVYLESDGRVMGQSTIEVGRFYADQGLSVAEDQTELPDHAVIELEFSAQMLLRAAAALEEGLIDEGDRILRQYEMFDMKLMRSWLPEFGQRIIDANLHPFYTDVGKLLQLLPPAPAQVPVHEFVESEEQG